MKCVYGWIIHNKSNNINLETRIIVNLCISENMIQRQNFIIPI